MDKKSLELHSNSNAISGETAPQKPESEYVMRLLIESIEARHERKEATILICSAVVVLVTIILCVVATYLNNRSWQSYLEQFDFESYSVSADGNSNANYVGGDVKGDINNGGEDSSTQENIEKESQEGKADTEKDTSE